MKIAYNCSFVKFFCMFFLLFVFKRKKSKKNLNFNSDFDNSQSTGIAQNKRKKEREIIKLFASLNRKIENMKIIEFDEF